MKRKVITFLIILVCFLLESTVFHNLTFASVCPNLMIIVTASFGFMRGKKTGMFVGFVSGLFVDLFWGQILGFHMMLFTVIGYLNGTFERLFYDEDIKLPLILTAASEFVYGLTVYILMFLLRSEFNFLHYLSHIIIPELIYTIVVTLGLYPLILFVNQRLKAEEKRSANKFV